MSTEEQHAAAVIAALDAAGAAPYDIDDVPDTLPAHYTEVYVSRRFGGEPRNAGAKGSTGWRIAVRVVAKTVTNARLLRAKVSAALDDVRLTVDGEPTTPVQFEGAEEIGPDDGWFSGLSTYTYAH